MKPCVGANDERKTQRARGEFRLSQISYSHLEIQYSCRERLLSAQASRQGSIRQPPGLLLGLFRLATADIEVPD